MTLEELSVVFSADLAPFSAAADQLSAMLSQLGAQADGLAGQFSSAGRMAGDGLAAGIMSRQGAVAAAARAVAQAAASALRGALQIHSPSRVTHEAGRYFDEGLISGIQACAGRVEKEAGSLGVRAAQSLQIPAHDITLPLQAASRPMAEDTDHALSRLSLTIPLEVDGYRLGVAAIEGINRVSQGSGRVELIM